MNEPLWSRFLGEEIENMTDALAWYGVTGILERFEEWLKAMGHLETPEWQPDKEAGEQE